MHMRQTYLPESGANIVLLSKPLPFICILYIIRQHRELISFGGAEIKSS